jgi:hypothetical protein
MCFYGSQESIESIVIARASRLLAYGHLIQKNYGKKDATLKKIQPKNQLSNDRFLD